MNFYPLLYNCLTGSLTHSVVEQRLYFPTELPMPGWRDLVDVQLQSLMIFQLPQYLHTVSQWLTENNSIPSREEGGEEQKEVNLRSPTNWK